MNSYIGERIYSKFFLPNVNLRIHKDIRSAHLSRNLKVNDWISEHWIQQTYCIDIAYSNLG